MSGPTMSSIACTRCGQFMRCAKNGVIVEELDSDGGPYRIWSSDRYSCKECGASVVIGFGRLPIAEHFEEEAYARAKARVAYQLR